MGSKESEYYFNVEGKLWEVNGERSTVFGGGRALLMQLAHPLVAQGVYDAGFLQRNPQKRLLNTLGSGLNLIFGTKEEVEVISSRINSIHERVQGELTQSVGSHIQGEQYSATDPNQLKWVAATIIDSSLIGFETLVRTLSKEEKDEYLKEATELFTLLNINLQTFPKTYQELQDYMQEMIDTKQVAVGDTARKLAPYAMLQHRRDLKILTYPIFKLTIGLLPPKIRRQYGFSWTHLGQEIFDKVTAGVRASTDFLPKKLRYSVLYRDAVRASR